MDTIQFNIPYTSDESFRNVTHLIKHPDIISQRLFSIECIKWLEKTYQNYKAFLTPSATQALELLAFSLEIKSGDEIIMSSFNYVGVATSFANHGAKLVFVDIDAKTMCLEVDDIESAITNKTKAIIATNYNGVAYKLEKIKQLCDQHNIIMIEDNAQGINCYNNDQLLGTYGDFSCISFDPLKNISAGEGGVLLCKKKWIDKVFVHYENGTNKQEFLASKIDAYQWTNKGSRYFMSEYNAAVLAPLLEKSGEILNQRMQNWLNLMKSIAQHPKLERLIPHYADYNQHNGHIAFIKLKDKEERTMVMQLLFDHNIQSSFHYIPLHNSIAGLQYGKSSGLLKNTIIESDRLLRLPMHNYLTNKQIDRIVKVLLKIL